MTLSKAYLLSAIDRKLADLERDYRSTQGLLLTEDDLKCSLYRRLAEIPQLSKPLPTREPGILATRLHAELAWFDENNKLRIKPDLTILEPENLQVRPDGVTGVSFPSKGYAFDGPAVLFELKFIRDLAGVRKNDVVAVQADIDKVARLFEKHRRFGAPGHLFCYIIVVSKVAALCREFSDFVSSQEDRDRFRIVQFTGNLPGLRRRHHGRA